MFPVYFAVHEANLIFVLEWLHLMQLLVHLRLIVLVQEPMPLRSSPAALDPQTSDGGRHPPWIPHQGYPPNLTYQLFFYEFHL